MDGFESLIYAPNLWKVHVLSRENNKNPSENSTRGFRSNVNLSK